MRRQLKDGRTYEVRTAFGTTCEKCVLNTKERLCVGGKLSDGCVAGYHAIVTDMFLVKDFKLDVLDWVWTDGKETYKVLYGYYGKPEPNFNVLNTVTNDMICVGTMASDLLKYAEEHNLKALA